jgi:hypothetical protein
MPSLAMVYDADGGLVGGVRYAIAHALGRARCDLCAISHEGVRTKAGFRALVDELEAEGFGVEVLHRNELSPEQAAAVEALPCVLISDPVATAGWSVLVGAAAVRGCDGDVETFSSAVRKALAARA